MTTTDDSTLTPPSPAPEQLQKLWDAYHAAVDAARNACVAARNAYDHAAACALDDTALAELRAYLAACDATRQAAIDAARDAYNDARDDAITALNATYTNCEALDDARPHHRQKARDFFEDVRKLHSPDSRGRCALAPGSIPVSSAEALAATWDQARIVRNALANQARGAGNIDVAIPLENAADAYERCASELRREIALANERQPESNQ